MSIRALVAAILIGGQVGLAGSVPPWADAAPVARELTNPAPPGARLPRLAALPGGGVVLSWVEPNGTGHALRFAVLKDGHWMRTGEVAKGADWFLNWADFPSVVPIDNNFWAAHWLVRQRGGHSYDYDIAVATSRDAGATWGKRAKPHRDSGPAEHGFVSIFPTGGGAGLIWLDGRDYVDPKDRARHPEKSGNFALRFAPIGHDGRLGDETVVDGSVCTCCPTAAVATPEGALLAYRARRSGEIRDNHVVRRAGAGWAAPVPLGDERWKFAGCPTNGPALAINGRQVAAAWYTAEGERPRVRAALSADGGTRFTPAFDVDDRDPIGRARVVWHGPNAAVVTWISSTDRKSGMASIAARRVESDGAMGPIVHLASVDSGRDSGMPQLASDGVAILIAWTLPGPGFGVRTAFIDPSVLGLPPSVAR